MHVPLREVRDAEGNTPDFAQVNDPDRLRRADMADARIAELAPAFRMASRRTLRPRLWIWCGGLASSRRLCRGGAGGRSAGGDAGRATLQGDMLAEASRRGASGVTGDVDGDGIYDPRLLHAAGFTGGGGAAGGPCRRGGVGRRTRAGSTGRSTRTATAQDMRELRLDGLPWGRHQNNGLVEPGPIPSQGELGGVIYWLRGRPATWRWAANSTPRCCASRMGQGLGDVEVVSRGNRNAYDVVWGACARRPSGYIGDGLAAIRQRERPRFQRRRTR